MRNILIGLALLATILAPAALGRGNVDFDLETKADLAVEARGASGYRYAWDWGDGEASAGVRATHQYRSPGVYKVVVTATDEAGREWSRVRELEVRAAAASPARADVDVDVDRDEVEASVDAKSSARVEWDWGDGHTSRGRRASHHYDEAGVYTVEVKVTERDGTCWTERRVVRIEADAPRRSDTHASGPAVSARVSIGSWDHEDEDEDEDEGRSRGYAYSNSDVSISSYDRHDAPGLAAPLVALATAGVALARKLARR